MNLEAEYHLVWAKLNGYPWWPALSPADPKMAKASKREGGKKHKVFFLGDFTQ
jgi:hypothetical protein